MPPTIQLLRLVMEINYQFRIKQPLLTARPVVLTWRRTPLRIAASVVLSSQTLSHIMANRLYTPSRYILARRPCDGFK